jgi:hypothetical protein
MPGKMQEIAEKKASKKQERDEIRLPGIANLRIGSFSLPRTPKSVQRLAALQRGLSVNPGDPPRQDKKRKSNGERGTQSRLCAFA